MKAGIAIFIQVCVLWDGIMCLYDQIKLGMEMKQPCASQLYMCKPDRECGPFWVGTEQLCIV